MESFNGKVWAGVDYTEGLWSQRSLMRKFKNTDVTLFKSNTDANPLNATHPFT